VDVAAEQLRFALPFSRWWPAVHGSRDGSEAGHAESTLAFRFSGKCSLNQRISLRKVDLSRDGTRCVTGRGQGQESPHLNPRPEVWRTYAADVVNVIKRGIFPKLMPG
jgi:hypothetical protein